MGDIMTGIKKIFKECFRYKLSGIAMVICLVISMLVAHYGILIFKNIVNENLDKENYQYQYNLSMTAYVNNMNEIPRIPDEIECNIRIPWVILYDSSENVSRIVDIIISSDEAKCPLISGEYPDNNVLESHERIILIGKDNMQYAYQKEGEWFYQIFGE